MLLHGIFPPVTTPFYPDGKVYFRKLEQNVEHYSRGPLAGMFHSLFLLVFILIAAPLASFIPLSVLGGILAIVAWNMLDRHAFATLLRSSWGDAVVLLASSPAGCVLDRSFPCSEIEGCREARP